MKNSLWKFTIASLLLILLLSSKLAHGQDEEGGGGADEEEEPEKTCQQYLFGLMRKVIAILPKCMPYNRGNRVGLKFRRPVEPLSRFYCIVKCLLAELEVLDDKGKLDEVNALFFFQDNIPGHVLPAVVEVAGPCLEMASTLVPEQYYCQSYGPFTQCLIRAFLLGLGPWALDCFGSPTFAGMFGVISYFVPPIQPGTPGSGSERRLIIPSANTTLLLKRMKELRKQRRLSMPNVLSNSTSTSQSHNLTTNTNQDQPSTTLPPPTFTETMTAADSYLFPTFPSSPSIIDTSTQKFNSTIASFNFTEQDMQLLTVLGEQLGLLVRPM